MKKIFTLITFIVLLFCSAYSMEVLKNYSENGRKLPYSNPSALYYMARFDLNEAIQVHKIRLYMEGSGNGILGIFGHEGGSAFGEVEEDLITPISFSKTQASDPFIDITIPEEVTLYNKQFFVKIDLRGSNLRLMRDTEVQSPYCESSDGGNFHPTVLAVNGSHPFYDHVWQVLNTALMVDVYYTPITPSLEKTFEPYTEELGFPLNMSSRTMAWGDYNGDGFLDLLVRGRLFENRGGDSFVEVTQELNIHGNARGNAMVDFNNDGLLDIILFHTQNHLYINQGDGTFSHHILDIPSFPSLSSFSFADLNNDGFPDLFVGQLWGAYPVPLPNYLFFNDGNLGLIDQTQKLYPEYNGVDNFPSGIVCDPNNSSTFLSGRNQNRRSRGSQFVDYNNDGHLDLYVTNYFLERDELYENDGQGNFKPVINQTGIDINTGGGSNHGTGVDWADYNNDGNMDLLLPRLAHPWGVKRFNHQGTVIYNNQGPPSFGFTQLEGAETGIEFEETHAGATWGDVDNDGLLDMVITTYYGCRYVNLYKQKTDHSFENVTFASGLDRVVTGEDAVFVDFNNDGKLDLCLGERNQFRIYKNIANDIGNSVQFDLIGSKSNSAGIGARVIVSTTQGTYTQEVSCGRGQRMQKPSRLFFGLGSEEVILGVEVKWPSGKTVQYGKMTSNSIYSLHEEGGIEGLNKPKKLTLYPNPNRGEIQFNFIADKVEILNLNGSTLGTENNVLRWNIEHLKLKAGTYVVKIRYNNQVQYEKIILF